MEKNREIDIWEGTKLRKDLNMIRIKKFSFCTLNWRFFLIPYSKNNYKLLLEHKGIEFGDFRYVYAYIISSVMCL